MFIYCGNNPTNYSDSLGLRPVSILERDGDKSIPVPARRKNQENTARRDVTEEILTPLSIAADRARINRVVSNFVLGNTICSDGFIYLDFYQLVNHEAPWDIKRLEQWESTIKTPFPGYDVEVVFCDVIMTPENLGNFTYGYLGYAYDIPKDHLLAGSYYAAGFPTSGDPLANEILDWKYVLFGYAFAQQAYRGR